MRFGQRLLSLTQSLNKMIERANQVTDFVLPVDG